MNMKKILVLIMIFISFNSLFAQDNNRNQKLSYGIEMRYLSTFDVGVDYLNGPNTDFKGAYGKSLRFNLGYFFALITILI